MERNTEIFCPLKNRNFNCSTEFPPCHENDNCPDEEMFSLCVMINESDEPDEDEELEGPEDKVFKFRARDLPPNQCKLDLWLKSKSLRRTGRRRTNRKVTKSA